MTPIRNEINPAADAKQTFVSIPEGQTLYLSCGVTQNDSATPPDADADYEMNWYLPDSVLERVVSTKERNEYRIQIEGMRVSDSGTYRCTAQRMTHSESSSSSEEERQEDGSDVTAANSSPANLVQKVVLKVKGGENNPCGS